MGKLHLRPLPAALLALIALLAAAPGGLAQTPEATPGEVLVATPAASEAVTGWLGAEREQFERAWGEPANIAREDDYPFGVQYDVDQFALVQVYYDNDRAIHITLYANRPLDLSFAEPHRADWSVRQARSRARHYLPPDVVIDLDHAYVNAGNEVAIPCRSDELAVRLGSDVYERYGALGEAGECQITLRVNQANEISVIEVGLGDGSPAAWLQDLSPLSDEETIYLGGIEASIDTLDASVDVFQDLIGSDDLDIALVNQELTRWRLVAEEARGVEHPVRFDLLHGAFVDATELLEQAAGEFVAGVNEGDRARIDAAGRLIRQSNELRAQLRFALAALGAER